MKAQINTTSNTGKLIRRLINGSPEPMPPTPQYARLKQLRDKLQKVRQKSLEAVRQGDYIRQGQLTREAAEINETILTLSGGENM